MVERCECHDKLFEKTAEKIAAIDKQQAVLDSHVEVLSKEVMDVKQSVEVLDRRLDDLPLKIVEAMPKSAPIQQSPVDKKWYQNQYVLIAAIVACVQALTKLLEKITATIGG